MNKKKIQSFFSTKWGILASIATVSLILDQWTKWLVHTSFRVGESRPIIDPILALTYVRNKGAAFGILQTANPTFRDPFFMMVPIIAIGVIGFLYYKLESNQKTSAIALALVLSGAVGNLIDRLRLGYVVDFLDVHWKDVYHWPAFNVADSCIVVGVAILFLQSFKAPTTASSKA